MSKSEPVCGSSAIESLRKRFIRDLKFIARSLFFYFGEISRLDYRSGSGPAELIPILASPPELPRPARLRLQREFATRRFESSLPDSRTRMISDRSGDLLRTKNLQS